FGQRLTLTTFGHCERPPTRPRSLRSRDPSRWTFTMPKCPTAHPGVTWLTKTPADSDLARSAREAPRRRAFLVGQVTLDLAVFICGTANIIKILGQRCAPPIAQAKRGGNCSGSSKNGENAQAACDRLRAASSAAAAIATTRLRTTAKAAQYQSQNKSTLQTFGFSG
ncbi:hypothetical protein TYRP_013993, partial [Tyrophagus putrescentiae]